MFDVFKNHNDDFLLNENVMDFPDKDYSDLNPNFFTKKEINIKTFKHPAYDDIKKDKKHPFYIPFDIDENC